MDRQHYDVLEVQSKLQRGLAILSSSTPEESEILGLALIKLHGALEDHIRRALVQRMPNELRDVIDDAGKTQWKDLLEYGRQYIGLTESDSRVIMDANRDRQQFAHGGSYSGGRAQIENYAAFVKHWCNQLSQQSSPLGSSLQKQTAREQPTLSSGTLKWLGRLGLAVFLGGLVYAYIDENYKDNFKANLSVIVFGIGAAIRAYSLFRRQQIFWALVWGVWVLPTGLLLYGFIVQAFK